MDVLAYCRAMAAFCRQRGVFEGESDTFWNSEATEWDKLISEHASPRRNVSTILRQSCFVFRLERLAGGSVD
jgi:hypothetical protein